MAEDLPEEFDLVVIGTGFPESCVAAAASRIGKTVLHIDPNDFYGGAWASFSLEAFCQHLDQGIGEEMRHASYKWLVDDDDKNDDDTVNTEQQQWTKSKLLEQTRRFNIDLCPKIMYASGELVQLLISSNICRYAEFRAVDRVCTRFQGQLLNVPCSRSDVFNTKDLNIVEKRLLMKFLTICMTYGEDKTDEDMAIYRGKTFREYLQQQKVTEKISTCIMQAIAMCDEDTLFEVGMERTQLFLNSLGRYGNTPFLFPMYGCGEIPQCFCRLCAVFGGIYCLKRRIADVTLDADTNSPKVILEEDSNGMQRHTIRAKHVVCSPGNVPVGLRQQPQRINGFNEIVNHLSRAVLIAASPLGNEELNSGGGGVNLLRLSADDAREALLIQLSHYSGTCPKDIFIFHLTTKAVSDNPEEDLQPFMTQLFTDDNGSDTKPPTILFSAFFTLTACTRAGAASAIDTPIYCTAAPYYELDYSQTIQNARDIFSKLYAGAEFLPRAPDPEEIVIDGEDPRALSEVNLPDDLRAQLRELEEATEQMEIENVAVDASIQDAAQIMDAE